MQKLLNMEVHNIMETTNNMDYGIKQFRLSAQTGKNQNKVRRVAALTRVSTQHEQQINALSNQNQWIMDEIIKHKNWVFDPAKDLYTDEGISGTSEKNRISFQKMIENAENGMYDLIVTREVSRFMRNLKDALNRVSRLKECGVEVYFINDNIWTFNDEDYLKLTLMGAIAEQDSRKLSERTCAGQEIARKKGVVFGNGNILGYKLVRGLKSTDNKYVIDEEQAETVRRIYQLALEGNGVNKIQRILTNEGRKTSLGNVNWHTSTVQRILRNPTYCGQIEYLKSYTEDPLTHKRVNQRDKSKRPRVKGKFEPIIPIEIWNAVQQEIDKRVNHNLNNNYNGKGVCVSKDIYCRKMRCECGRRFRKNKGRKDGMASYLCYNIIQNGSVKKRESMGLSTEGYCSLPGIIDWKLSLYTNRVFKHLTIKADEIKMKVIEAIEQYYVDKEDSKLSKTTRAELEQDIDKFERKIDTLIEMRSDGEITKEQFLAKKAEVETMLLKKREILLSDSQKDEDTNQKEECIKQVKEYLDKVLNFESSAVSDKIVDAYVNSIKVYNDNTFEYNINLNANVHSDRPEEDNDNYQVSNADSIHKIDNSSAKVLDEFQIHYEEARAYANSLKRKVNKVHWQTVTIRIVADI